MGYLLPRPTSCGLWDLGLASQLWDSAKTAKFTRSETEPFRPRHLQTTGSPPGGTWMPLKTEAFLYLSDSLDTEQQQYKFESTATPGPQEPEDKAFPDLWTETNLFLISSSERHVSHVTLKEIFSERNQRKGWCTATHLDEFQGLWKELVKPQQEVAACEGQHFCRGYTQGAGWCDFPQN